MCLLMPFTAINAQERAYDQKIDSLISQMTLDEKVDFIGGLNDFNIRSIDRLGIPKIQMADGPVGVRNFGPSTAYAASIALAASWDTMLANKVGKAIADEAKSKDVHIMLGPGMNIYRAPMCGRNFEYLGEDPFLAGKIASSYIIGMQHEGVMATAKHYLANNQEYNRHNGSSDIDERTMQEIYLPAFKAAVTEGKVACVMTSYNLINGIHASQNDYLINKILKSDWGFNGFVMSDWGSTYDGVAAANAGLDIEMPSGTHMNRDTLMPALKDRRLTEKIIDDKLRRILRMYARFGLLDSPDKFHSFMLDSEKVRQIAIDEARGGIVLLKNETNILPLDKSKIKSIAIIGPNAHPAVTGGGGSSFVQPLNSISLLDAIKKVAKNDIKISYDPGIYGQDPMPSEFFDHSDFYTYIDGKKVPGLKAEFQTGRWEEAKTDSVKVFPKVNTLIKKSQSSSPASFFSVHFTGYLRVTRGGTYRFIVSGTSGYRLSINDKELIGVWHVNTETQRSVLFDLEPDKEYKIELRHFQHTKEAFIRLGYETPEDYEKNAAKAMEKTKNIVTQNDLTILSLGFNSETEHEGSDRTYALPDNQIQLIREIIKTGKEFIVVMNAGGNVDMTDWLGKCKALIYAWYPGQEGTIAVAEIIMGITNPSGKLPVSFEKQWKDNATYNSYYDPDSDNHVQYSEGIFLGYRHFDKDNIEPLFPFGFGLSYTSFEYSNLMIAKDSYSINELVEVKLTIRNTGKYSGAEVVQLYVGQQNPSFPRPLKELKGFTKVTLAAGESKEVVFKLGADAFHYFNPDKKQWIVETGNFDIMVGSSSRDIRLNKQIEIF